MIRPDLVQSGLIAHLKTKTAVTDLLSSTGDIKEDQWQGRDFVYPAIRFGNIALIPQTDNSCELYSLDLAWYVFSEKPSSWEADKISGIINAELNNAQFSVSVTDGDGEIYDLQFYLRTIQIQPAERIDERTWKSVVVQIGRVSNPT